MLYVVIRDIEGGVRSAAFASPSLDEARQAFEEAKRVCDNDPDEFGEGDPTIVSQCWLFEANAEDADQAIAMARDGHGRTIASYSKEDF